MQMNHHYYRVVVSYNGSNYFGWQDLGADEEKATVQGTITQALRKICKYADCTVAGASRTDAGVHAQGQVAKFSIPLEITPEKIQRGLNSLLPDDIRIWQSTCCQADFNPNKQSISKKYRYYFSIDLNRARVSLLFFFCNRNDRRQVCYLIAAKKLNRDVAFTEINRVRMIDASPCPIGDNATRMNTQSSVGLRAGTGRGTGVKVLGIYWFATQRHAKIVDRSTKTTTAGCAGSHANAQAAGSVPRVLKSHWPKGLRI